MTQRIKILVECVQTQRATAQLGIESDEESFKNLCMESSTVTYTVRVRTLPIIMMANKLFAYLFA